MISATNTEEWTVDELADYMKQRALDLGGDFSDNFRSHKIDGSVYARLNDADLKEMGIDKVGDRLRVLQELESISQLQDAENRDRIYWEGKEEQYAHCWDWCLTTNCGCCPGDNPAEYEITGIKLSASKVEQHRCGPIPLVCWRPRYIDDVIYLSQVRDVEEVIAAPGGSLPCCKSHLLSWLQTENGLCCGFCDNNQVQLYVKTNENVIIILKLKRDEAEGVKRRILSQARTLASSAMERS